MNSRFLLVMAAVVVMLAGSVQADTMAWQTPTSVPDSSVIDLTGTLVHAGNWGSGTDQSVVAGPETILFNLRSIDGSDPLANATAAGNTDQTDAWAGTGDAAFEGVMDTFAFDGDNPKTVTIGGLTAGNDYQIQLFASDGRGCCGGRTQTWSDDGTGLGVGNQSDIFAHTGEPAGFGVSTIGTFTATGTSNTIFGYGVDQSQTIINGYVLRDVSAIPEPGSLLALVGLMGMAIVKRRRC